MGEGNPRRGESIVVRRHAWDTRCFSSPTLGSPNSMRSAARDLLTDHYEAPWIPRTHPCLSGLCWQLGQSCVNRDVRAAERMPYVVRRFPVLFDRTSISISSRETAMPPLERCVESHFLNEPQGRRKLWARCLNRLATFRLLDVHADFRITRSGQLSKKTVLRDETKRCRGVERHS